MDNSVRAYNRITEEIKAEIIAGLVAGLSVSEMSRRTTISKAAVSKIKQELDKEIAENYQPETKRRIDDMLINSLKIQLEAIEGIAEIAKDKSYLQSQDAKNLAELHSGFVNWAIQLLEAASRDK